MNNFTPYTYPDTVGDSKTPLGTCTATQTTGTGIYFQECIYGHEDSSDPISWGTSYNVYDFRTTLIVTITGTAKHYIQGNTQIWYYMDGFCMDHECGNTYCSKGLRSCPTTYLGPGTYACQTNYDGEQYGASDHIYAHGEGRFAYDGTWWQNNTPGGSPINTSTVTAYNTSP